MMIMFSWSFSLRMSVDTIYSIAITWHFWLSWGAVNTCIADHDKMLMMMIWSSCICCCRCRTSPVWISPSEGERVTTRPTHRKKSLLKAKQEKKIIHCHTCNQAITPLLHCPDYFTLILFFPLVFESGIFSGGEFFTRNLLQDDFLGNKWLLISSSVSWSSATFTVFLNNFFSFSLTLTAPCGVRAPYRRNKATIFFLAGAK